MENFKLIPVESVPAKISYYEDTINKFLNSKLENVLLHLNGKSIDTARNGFSRSIKKKFSDKVKLCRIDNELYLEKL